jgi:hypothetical protein
MLPEAGDCSITSLTARDFFNVYGVKTRLELLIDCGLDIPVEGYVRLVRCLNHYVTRIRPNARKDGSNLSVLRDFLPLKNPGKKIRATLVKKRGRFSNLKTMQLLKNI